MFADLGFEPEDAAALQARSKHVILEKIAIKQYLMTELSNWIAENTLKQEEAAECLGITGSHVLDIINNRHINFTIDALVGMVARSGKRVVLTVQ